MNVSFRYQSPDVSALVREVITKEGWQSGQALSFLIKGEGYVPHVALPSTMASSCSV
jgi:hypothetical protein